MSAFIAVKHADCIQLLTDGACYNGDYILTAIVSKVWAARCVPIAITGRGTWSVLDRIAKDIVEEADETGSVDHVIECFIPEYLDGLRATDMQDVDGDVSIAAWSETTGPQLYYINFPGGKFGGEGKMKSVPAFPRS
ncbi:hypothetical protein EN850_20835 [Mesorhizobium sp. M8A.F.Ca.ET.207.01.1.1]|uniref:hypothetical protein n=1 Tax=Mesorhizobium sp. M8A.F.Ca.ET.207.01.1.1 TaxID=2563968 RepID=UPI00109BF686|nr:hypothetical protein [Mesorhizobium sp. M8A.F.Ca.ET.207.01.1.1]TGQ79337.1 hypothetical protein EN850_20835 [Mesorhizobium sp. M8A.F.Ca.ET.207.01.1.1]